MNQNMLKRLLEQLDDKRAAPLRTSTVRRGGITTRIRETVEDPNVRLVPTGGWGTLDIWLTINSKGGGYTAIEVEIEPEDFKLLLRGMLVQDRRRTLRMIIGEIARHPKQFRHLLRQITRAAREPALTAMLEEISEQLRKPEVSSDGPKKELQDTN